MMHTAASRTRMLSLLGSKPAGLQDSAQYGQHHAPRSGVNREETLKRTQTGPSRPTGLEFLPFRRPTSTVPPRRVQTLVAMVSSTAPDALFHLSQQFVAAPLAILRLTSRADVAVTCS